MNQNSEIFAPASRKDPFLIVLGERVRALRARSGMTRRTLARAASVSERHLANLESGQGNASVMLLRQLASVASTEASQIRQLLRGRDEASLGRARRALAELFGAGTPDPARSNRIALIGLRGAGKSTLGRMLADDLGIPFVELNRGIERLAGCDVHEIHSLYGSSAYRRYELRAVEDAIAAHPRAVIATGGGLVSETVTFDLLLTRCFTVWLRASPDDHMKRVIAQGDLRPMAGNAEAMSDLKRILAGREPAYARADLTFDTTGRTAPEAFVGLRAALKPRLAAAA
jgi:XRE family aerobic/anaerobic benzoate catabolism transcriptional regulator